MTPAGLDIRYELLPFGRANEEAAAVSEPLTLTVTCSPRLGLDAALDFACGLRAAGHRVVLHVAARMVRSSEHLSAVLDRMNVAGVSDVFLVGGDLREPLGPYRSGGDLIAELVAHPDAPRSLGIPGYPEGHPLIEPDALLEALQQKARHADYIATQICFEPEAIRGWISKIREAGVDLPVYLGVPGAVDARRLLEISAKVGVGASISYLRKQHGIRRLLGQSLHATERIAATLLTGDEPRTLGIAGLHFFTFNRLVETRRFVNQQLCPSAMAAAPVRGALAR